MCATELPDGERRCSGRRDLPSECLCSNDVQKTMPCATEWEKHRETSTRRSRLSSILGDSQQPIDQTLLCQTSTHLAGVLGRLAVEGRTVVAILFSLQVSALQTPRIKTRHLPGCLSALTHDGGHERVVGVWRLDEVVQRVKNCLVSISRSLVRQCSCDHARTGTPQKDKAES